MLANARRRPDQDTPGAGVQQPVVYVEVLPLVGDVPDDRHMPGELAEHLLIRRQNGGDHGLVPGVTVPGTTMSVA